jgi:hypothetical protein
VLFTSTGMAAAMTGFLLTQEEIGLFSVSAVFGVAFGGQRVRETRQVFSENVVFA